MKYDPKIDKNNLDEEAVYTPAVFDLFAVKEAEASDALETFRDQLKVVQAEIALELRGWDIDRINEYFDKRIMKLTEAVYSQLVIVHPDVITLMNRISQARHDLKIYEAARKSIEEKSRGLDRLVKLHGQGYYMKIEGRPYKKLEADTVQTMVKRAITKRLEREKKKKPPARQPMKRKKIEP